LGDQAVASHQALGREAGRTVAQVVIAIGAYARVVADGATTTAGTGKRIYWFPTVEAAEEKISALIEAGDTVLFKASRAMRLERLIERLQKSVQPAGVG
jgi:UDP-N-acetylmuramoyl-tripeptide--D-alanyl-D-alanine ligase